MGSAPRAMDKEEPPPLKLDRQPDAFLAVLTLNRPDRLNAVSQEMYEALADTLESLKDDNDIRALVITGEGRAFCVGADLKSHHDDEKALEQRRVYVQAGQSVNRTIQTFPKPVIAAVNGHAIGAGMELALSCDLVLVSETAKLRFPELGLGTFVGGGTVYTLLQRVGMARAKELLLLGRFFTPQHAVAIGLANEVVPQEMVLPEALEWAREAAAKAPTSVAFAKQLLDEAQRLDHGTALEKEAEALLACMQTSDWREGIEAFHEKRPPSFTGA